MRIELLNISKENTGKMLLDFSGIDIIDSSFADELVGKLVLCLGFLGFNKRFAITDANYDVEVILERAISIRAKELFDS